MSWYFSAETPQQRGFDDGMAGRPRAGESEAYGDAYTRGMLAAGVNAGRWLLALSEGSRCPRCGVHYVGAVGGCGCEHSGEQALERGAFVISGPDVRTAAPTFMPAGELRTVIAMGVRILDMDGVDVSCQIQITQ